MWLVNTVTNVPYDDIEILEAIQEVAERVEGKLSAPDYRDVCDDQHPSVRTADKRFGSWNQAKQAADLETTTRRTNVPLDEWFFEPPYSDEALYWAGMLLADGSVRSENNELKLLLQEREHIEKFKRDLSSGHAIVETQGCYQISFASEIMTRDLASLGVVPRKTNQLTLPDIEGDQWRHYLRGWIDGDGHVRPFYTTENSAWGWQVELAGNVERMRAVRQHFPVETSLCHEEYMSETGRTAYLRVNGAERVYRLYQFLYPDGSERSMDRKQEAFEQLNHHRL